jgi:protein O-GlcNAc transferase
MLSAGEYADLQRGMASGIGESYAQRLEHLAGLHADDARLWFLLGAARHRLGRLEAALDAFDRTLGLAPGHLQALNAKAGLLAALNRPAQAMALLDEACRLHPQDPSLLVNRGYLLEQQAERRAEALACYDAALAIDPGNRGALMNRGGLLTAMDRLPEALDNNRRLVAAHPRDAVAHYNLAETLLALGHDAAVLEACANALELAPDAVEAILISGLALSVMGRFEEARDAFRRAESKDIAAVKGFIARSTAFLGQGGATLDPELIYLVRGYHPLKTCDWRTRDVFVGEFVRLMQERVEAGGEISDPSLVYDALALPMPGTLNLGIARLYSKRCSSDVGPKPNTFARPAARAGRLRIGYLSPDFREHLNAYLLRPLIEFHDRSRFDVVCYSSGPADDSRICDRVRAAADEFVDVWGLDADTVVDRIRAAGIDILVDTGGVTTFSRPDVTVRQAAPLQVSYLGFPGTLGMQSVQYRISDRIATPDQQQHCWSESLVYLPDTFFVYDASDRLPAPPLTRAEYGLPERGFVFCAFNNYYKIEPKIFDVWMAIVKAVPGSVVWFAGRNPIAVGNLRREAALRGVAPDRLVFAPFEDRNRYLARFALADLFLDTLIFNAMTTACDALAAGLPVLTCPGESFTSRVAASLLTAAGFTEGIAGSPSAYRERAIAWGLDPESLQVLRRTKLSDVRATPLFDARARVRQLEAAYEAMWRRHESGLPPKSFEVSRKRAEPTPARWF